MTRFQNTKRTARYRFDNLIARGMVALTLGLAIVATISVAVVTMAAVLIDPRSDTGAPRNPAAEMWGNMVRTFDLGAADQPGQVGFHVLMLLLSIGGVLILSALIGVITTGIQDKLDELRRGRSLVIERDHTVILGWSEQIYTILSELAEANSNRRGACVAILSERDKVDMDGDIRANIPDMRGTRIVCRTGNLLNPGDIDLVNPQEARSVIVLPPPGDRKSVV